MDFWTNMGICQNLNTREWQFLSDECDMVPVSGIHGTQSKKQVRGGDQSSFCQNGAQVGM